MPYNIKRRIYDSLPFIAKNAVSYIPFSILAGHSYRKIFGRMSHIDSLERKEVIAYQERELAKVLKFATDQVPAYEHLRKAVSECTPFEALNQFPLVTKEEIQENFKRYLPRCLDEISHYMTTTGGTSGNQLNILVDDNSQSIEMAFMHRQWSRVGYTTKDKKATFRGVAFPNLPDGVYWQMNPIYNELQFSPFHMSSSHLEKYARMLCEYSPSFLHGYPSALDVLAKFILKNRAAWKLPNIKAVFLGSEGASSYQRENIELAFQAKVYSWYGHTEKLILGGECECSTSYHQFPDYGFLEIVDDDGLACDIGARGEIVGTGYLNRSMPLIRYRTGDSATRLESRCECGRNWDRFNKVEGRWKQEMIIGKSGAPISVAALNMHGSIFERVERYQYYQEKKGNCILRIVAGPGFSESDSDAIINAFKGKVGSEVEFRIQQVNDIPLTVRGKLRIFDSKLDINRYL